MCFHLGKSIRLSFIYVLPLLILFNFGMKQSYADDRADLLTKAADIECKAAKVYDKMKEDLLNHWDKLRTQAEEELNKHEVALNRANATTNPSIKTAELKKADTHKKKEKELRKKADEVHAKAVLKMEARDANLATCEQNRHYASQLKADSKTKPKSTAKKSDPKQGFWDGLGKAIDKDIARNGRVVDEWKKQIVDSLDLNKAYKPIFEFKP